MANLLNVGQTAISTDFSNARAEDTDVNVIIGDETGTIDAAKLSLITAKTGGTVTLQNAQTISGTGTEVTAALKMR